MYCILEGMLQNVFTVFNICFALWKLEIIKKKKRLSLLKKKCIVKNFCRVGLAEWLRSLFCN